MDDELIEQIRALSKGAIIVIDGFSGSGKTSLACRLSRKLNIQYIDTDCFVTRQSGTEHYLSLIDIEQLNEIVKSFIKRKRALIFSGICAQETLEYIGVKPGHKVYVKKISSSGLWHGGLHIEEFINKTEPSAYYQRQPHKSDMEYHVKYEPQNNADFIYEYVRD